MPFHFGRRSTSKPEYSAVSFNDYDGLERDGVDAESPTIHPHEPVEATANPDAMTASAPFIGGVLDFEDDDNADRTRSIALDIDAELRKMRADQRAQGSRRSSLQQSRPSSRRDSGELESQISSSDSRAANIDFRGPLKGPSPRNTSSPSSGPPGNPSPARDHTLASCLDNIPDSLLVNGSKASPGSERGLEGRKERASVHGVSSVNRPDYKGKQPANNRWSSPQSYNDSMLDTQQIHVDRYRQGPRDLEEDDGESVRTPLVHDRQEQRGIYHEQVRQNPDGSYARSKRRGSAGSMDTFQQAATLFHDFDGTHMGYHDGIEDEDGMASGRSTPQAAHRQSRPQSSLSLPHPPLEALDVTEEHIVADGIESKRHSMLSLGNPEAKRKSTMTMGPVRPQTPPEGHVYYPAPIPAILNLPPKLSRGRTAADLQRKKEEIIMAANARKPELTPGMYDASSMRGAPTTELDPHLKASLYFDHAPVKHVLRLINGSATRTLDHILNVSAGAPLGAFTDHPYAGKLGPEVYGPEIKTKDRKSAQLLTAKRKSTNPLSTAYNKSGPDHDGSDAQTSDGDDDHDYDDEEREEDGFLTQEANNFQNSIPEYIPVDAAKPTTLLAELQIRKQEQKERNRTAATAFPNGVHSTLLQLDAVAQHQAQVRRGRRIHLAWEDPEALLKDDEDDEVPLGVLMPGAQRPEGGLLPPVPQPRDMTPSPVHDGAEGNHNDDDDDDDEPEETMAERKARLAREAEEKRRFTLSIDGLQEIAHTTKVDSEDDDVPLAVRRARLHARNGSDFASEVMSQLGGLDEANKRERDPEQSAVNTKKVPARHRASRSALSLPLSNASGKKMPEAEETLGQRRQRLRAEQAAREGAKLLQKEVRRRRSSIDLLNQPDASAEQSNSSPYLQDTATDNAVNIPAATTVTGAMASSSNLVMGSNGVLQFQPQQQPAQGFLIPRQQQQQQQFAQTQHLVQGFASPVQARPPQHQPQVFIHPAFAGNMNLLQQNQMSTSYGRPGHMTAYQQQQLIGLGGAGSQTTPLEPHEVNTGRRDMVDRWRQGVTG